MNCSQNNKNTFNLDNFIDNFVYNNWKNLKYTYNIENIEVEIKTQEEIQDEELLCRDIIYNEY